MASSLPGFVQGVIIEVLWDVERITLEGRSRGERIMESVWWRGEVVDVIRGGGKITAKIRYDAMGGFETQVGNVHVFPYHLQLIDENEKTQLRWRYYESSGEVAYDTSHVDHDKDTQMLGSPGCYQLETNLVRFRGVENKLEGVISRVEEVERLLLAERAVYSRLLGSQSYADHSCQKIFALLRQKLAGAVQKPLLSYRRSEVLEHTNNLFDVSCAGSIRAAVDCSIEEFENVCRSIRCCIRKHCFRVDGRHLLSWSGSLQASVSVAEIFFDSLCGICEAVGVCDESDISNIAQRQRDTGKKRCVEDVAIRVAGSFLVDNDADDTPPAILVCHGLHEGLSAEHNMDVLTRLNRELDPRTVWYRHPLCTKNMTILSLLHHVYPNECNTNCGDHCKDTLMNKHRDQSCFALRWKPMCNPNAKLWTRTMLMRPDTAGALEIEIPYVLIRGLQGVNEIKDLVTGSYIKKQMG